MLHVTQLDRIVDVVEEASKGGVRTWREAAKVPGFLGVCSGPKKDSPAKRGPTVFLLSLETRVMGGGPADLERALGNPTKGAFMVPKVPSASSGCNIFARCIEFYLLVFFFSSLRNYLYFFFWGT